MAQAETTVTTEPKCEPVKALLDEITKELDKFEARKLGELKSDLDAFVKKQEALVTEYKKQYPILRQKWCDQQTLIESLYASMKCAFPGQDWKSWIRDCVCKKRHERNCLAETIEKRKRCCHGKRQRARDRSKARLEAAKKRLDELSANVQKITGVLGDNDKLIAQIPKLLGPDQRLAMHLLLFKLLPAHKSIAPDDTKCTPIGDDDTPDKLCPPQACDSEVGACTPGNEVEDDKVVDKKRHPVPWLIRWEKYENELTCAWHDYREAKEDWAIKEAEFKSDPDDLASLEKKLADVDKTLDDEIVKCLKKVGPNGHCCDQPPKDKDCPPDEQKADAVQTEKPTATPTPTTTTTAKAGS